MIALMILPSPPLLSLKVCVAHIIPKICDRNPPYGTWRSWEVAKGGKVAEDWELANLGERFIETSATATKMSRE
ncbi:uncharacterized protein BT62DRAFT_318327 [Guyanagaster necrorhizus]|uniref:Uncharacterized protein n=1 Tax=Guyanagaster necrorhizus TaxID=856835 RepID=A0A9P7VMY4_9AGAR|nr:uncharacterized protein BT62DRAFT_318327 [Guyanagaster necrorhizus MCA 3950]KAG7443582.1 hypothetical protein BT62DRAFT_318327 [Guyanagaster necrorhizus MCA 3950]